MLIFAAAGHHAAYLLPADNAAWAPLPLLTKNPVVGMLPDPLIAAAEVEVPAGGTLHLFSDGVFEIIDRQGRQLGLEDIVAMLPVVASNEAAGDPKGGDPKGGDPKGGDPKGGDPGRDDTRRLYDRVRAIARPGQLDDDFSALVFRFP